MNKKKNKISVAGENTASINNAFETLHLDNLPSMDVPVQKKSANSKPSEMKKLGRVFLRIEKNGRAGKIVTILEGPGIKMLAIEKRNSLLKDLKQKFACGGCVSEDTIELQGDERDRIRLFLTMLGFSA